MGFFSNMYTKEGPGVPKDAPPKKGIARYFEIMIRDFGLIWRATFLTMLCFLPAAAFGIFTIIFRQYLGMLAIGFVGYMLSSILAGPALCALHAIVIKCVREEPCYLMHIYKKAWKENFKQAVPVGMLMMFLLGTEGFMAVFYLTGTENGGYLMMALVFFSLLVVSTCSLLVFMQMLFLDMNVRGMMRNSLLMMFGYALRAVPAGFIPLAVFVVAFLALPTPFWPLVFLLGVPGWLTVWCDMLIWPVMEKAFQITERQAEQKSGQQGPVGL